MDKKSGQNDRNEILKRKFDEPSAESGWDQLAASVKLKTLNDNPYLRIVPSDCTVLHFRFNGNQHSFLLVSSPIISLTLLSKSLNCEQLFLMNFGHLDIWGDRFQCFG